MFPDHPALVADLERASSLRSAIVEVEATDRELTPAARESLREIQKAANKLRELLGEAADPQARYSLQAELLEAGRSPKPSEEYVARALREAPVAAMMVVHEEAQAGEIGGENIRATLLHALLCESDAREEQGGEPIEFLRRLSKQLAILSETAASKLEEGAAGGRPPELAHRAIAEGVAARMKQHGVQPTKTRGGPYENALRLCLESAGASVPDDLATLMRQALKG